MTHNFSVILYTIRRDRARDSDHDRDEQHRRELDNGGWCFSKTSAATRKKPTSCHAWLRE